MKRAYMLQENGQVTLPIEFRRKYGLAKGDIVLFEEVEEGLIISPAQVQTIKHSDGYDRQMHDTEEGDF
jgi:AbrB family looped-hinge helix DNA binding protein